jgi:predicted transcriptional regulator
MYQRWDERSVFTNNTRHHVFVRVSDNPGASIQDIATMLGISHPTAAYHLKILEGNGLVVAMRDGNRTRFFKRSEALSQDQQRLVAANRSERSRQILDIVKDKPMIHRKELARLVQVPRTTLNWYVDRLIAQGLLAERRAGRYCQLFLPLHFQGPGPQAAPAATAGPVEPHAAPQPGSFATSFLAQGFGLRPAPEPGEPAEGSSE